MENKTSETSELSSMEKEYATHAITLLIQMAVLMFLGAAGIDGILFYAIGFAVVIIMPFVYGNYIPGVVYYRRMGIAYRLITLFLGFLLIYKIPNAVIEEQIPAWVVVGLFMAISNVLKKGEESKTEENNLQKTSAKA